MDTLKKTWVDSDLAISAKAPMLMFCALLLLGLLPGCHSHKPPAPVEEHSNSQVKRQINEDGTYSVRPGDTLYAIAFSYGLDHRDMAEWNEIPAPYVIHPGQALNLSPPARSSNRSGEVQISTAKTPGQVTTREHTTVASAQKPVPPKQEAPAVAGSASTQAQAQTVTQQTPAPQATKTPVTSPPVTKAQNSADPANWIWPTSGRVLRGYVVGNPARNGLDITGKEGQAIIATAGGNVVYSGNGLIGYGELIIIKHSERMLSAYAHNKSRLVQEGDQVSQGQKIAEMGRNDQNEELLHFEIRTRGKPVNPMGYLPDR
jgi:lipoprotein NlpD